MNKTTSKALNEQYLAAPIAVSTNKKHQNSPFVTFTPWQRFARNYLAKQA